MNKDEYALAKTRYIAVYGTLRAGRGNHRLLKDCTMVYSGYTADNYRMFGRGIPFVVHTEGEGYPIKVEVYRVDNAIDLLNLDNLEGHPTIYQRTPIKLDNGNDAELYMYQSDEQYMEVTRTPEYLTGDFMDEPTVITTTTNA